MGKCGVPLLTYILVDLSLTHLKTL